MACGEIDQKTRNEEGGDFSIALKSLSTFVLGASGYSYPFFKRDSGVVDIVETTDARAYIDTLRES